jgi:inorganic pyrophosphatase
LNVDDGFWQLLDRLVATSRIVIDRPKGSAHPRYPDLIYPVDYGYLADTTAPDGNEIDVYRGSLPDATVGAVVCTVDERKRDSEVKVLLGCTAEDTRIILARHNTGGMQRALLVERPRG